MAEAKVEPNYVFVDKEEDFTAALVDLARYKEVAFDAEGVSLGRGGSLTVISLLAVGQNRPAYVIDVQVLGGARVFSKELPSLRMLLEDNAVTKVTFDCRMDSDALFHLFGVNLTGVLELQVLEQAVRIQGGEAPPQKSLYFQQSKGPFLKSMSSLAKRYLSTHDVQKLEAPHMTDSQVWGKRPLSEQSIKYASCDVHVINALCVALRKVSLSEQLATATRQHSERYEKYRRDQISSSAISMRDEVAIIDAASLPHDHPRKEPPNGGRHGEKWDEAVAQLQSPKRDPRVYSNVMFVLQHDHWYTDVARSKIQSLAKNYPHFSSKQRANIADPPSLDDGQAGWWSGED